MSKVQKLTTAGVLVAVGVALSAFYIPIGASKCLPIQHMVNVLAGVLLGPVYAVGMAFVTSLIRFMMGTGSLLAFPGSMVGALFAGLLFHRTGKMWTAYLGELFGTGILGALIGYPVAKFLMGSGTAAAFTYVVPFLISSTGGCVIAFLLLGALRKTGLLGRALQTNTN